jgi:hypothetical protein
MAATYVTKTELRTNLGIGTLYTDAVVEEVCQTAQDLLNQYLWFNDAPIVAAGLQNNVATLVIANPGIFVKGQNICRGLWLNLWWPARNHWHNTWH